MPTDPFRPHQRWVPPTAAQLREIPDIEVLCLLGHGGMGAVYLARQITANRYVALKVARVAEGRSKTYLSLLFHEAQVMGLLDHENIVRSYDFGRKGELAWLVMERVEGSTLRDLLRARRVSPELAMRLSRQMCDALRHAHSRGVIHHDFKPENILVDRDGNAKIVDFGLSKVSEFSYTIAKPGSISGTLQYMAPEQLSHSRDIDYRIDIYALGVMMYEMLTGHLPTGSNPSPAQYRNIGQPLDRIIRKCLKRNRDDRWQTAADLLEALLATPCELPPVNPHSSTVEITIESPAAEYEMSTSSTCL